LSDGLGGSINMRLKVSADLFEIVADIRCKETEIDGQVSSLDERVNLHVNFGTIPLAPSHGLGSLGVALNHKE